MHKVRPGKLKTGRSGKENYNHDFHVIPLILIRDTRGRKRSKVRQKLKDE